jgi:guanine deaminase
MTDRHRIFMARAIELAEKTSLVDGAGAAFGAVIVRDGTILAEGANRVAAEHDPTWHAEMEAIRNACKSGATSSLRGATLYASGEPCVMCMAAARWAEVDQIYYASTDEDVLTYGGFGSAENETTRTRSIPTHQIMQAEAVAVWKKYRDRISRTPE